MLAGTNKELQRILHLRNNGKITEASKKLAEYEKKNHKTETNIRIQIIKAFLVSPEQTWERSLEIIESVILRGIFSRVKDNSLTV